MDEKRKLLYEFIKYANQNGIALSADTMLDIYRGEIKKALDALEIKLTITPEDLPIFTLTKPGVVPAPMTKGLVLGSNGWTKIERGGSRVLYSGGTKISDKFLRELFDVDTTLPTVDGQVLVWDDTNKYWKVLQSYERHIQIPAFLSGTAANQPTAVTVGTAAGLQFPSTPNKSVGIQWEIPDDWDGNDAYIELDWFPDSGAMSGTDALKWDVSYRSITEGETITNGTAVDLTHTDTDDYAQYTTKHRRFTLDADNANQPMVKQDHMYLTITRDTTVANDFAGTVVITAFEIMYTSVTLPTSN